MDQEAYLREAAEDTLRREADARRFLYNDVVELIQTGFLTQRFTIDGIPIVLRSLNSREITDLLLRGSYGTDIDWMRQKPPLRASPRHLRLCNESTEPCRPGGQDHGCVLP
jgi:hypothetical protein